MILELITLLVILGALIGFILLGWSVQVQKHEARLRHKRWMKEQLKQDRS
tara:strand:+ start:748 stop:897 length:150 start_codon:yes stop_codon:yes gene_type:complete